MRVLNTGRDLLRAIEAVLKEIQCALANDDASSQAVLQLAPDENPVQQWLAEQIKLRSKDRYHVAREPEVADENIPDILVSSTSATAQLALEVKHGNKRWTFKQLEHALRRQLVHDYLRTAERRHGILLITQHKTRTWKAPNGTPLSFPELIAALNCIAAELIENDTGPVTVRVIGIDATRPPKLVKR